MAANGNQNFQPPYSQPTLESEKQLPLARTIKPFLSSDWDSVGLMSIPEQITITGDYYILIGQSVSAPGGKDEVTFYMGCGGHVNETGVPLKELEDRGWVVGQQWNPNQLSLVRKETWS